MQLILMFLFFVFFTCRFLLEQENGETRWNLPSTFSGVYEVNLRLPKDVTCTQCVFQWKHTTSKPVIIQLNVKASEIFKDKTSSARKGHETQCRAGMQ